MSPPLPFPRTVPRTSSLPQQVQPLVPQQPLRTPTPDAMLHSKSPYLPEIPPVPTNEPLPLHQLLQQHQHNQQNQHNQQAQGVQQSCSTDRYVLCVKKYTYLSAIVDINTMLGERWAIVFQTIAQRSPYIDKTLMQH